MTSKGIPLAHLPQGKSGRILYIHERVARGHHGRHHRGRQEKHQMEPCFHRRLNALGIREGQIIRVVSRQPLMGPLTISIGSCQMTIGRGMAHKILVEEL